MHVRHVTRIDEEECIGPQYPLHSETKKWLHGGGTKVRSESWEKTANKKFKKSKQNTFHYYKA